MYRQQPMSKLTLKGNPKKPAYPAETIENKVFRITNNKEPIKDGAPLVYQTRAEGINPQYDIRTDRWEIALDAMSTVNKTHVAKRDERIGEKTYDTMNEEQQKQFREKYPNNPISKQQQQNPGTGASS